MKKKILFICTHNSARSQMAEGLCRTLYGEGFETYSAGTEPTSVHPHAVKVMQEIGIDISSQQTKHISEFKGKKFDLVVTVCDYAKETCPFFPGAKQYIHKNFEDPAGSPGSSTVTLAKFREVRDRIKEWLVQGFAKG